MNKNRQIKSMIIMVVILLGITFNVVAQDVISFNDGTLEKAKVLEIGENEIKYKKWDNQEGPTYSVSKSKIMSILYQNGTFEKISKTSAVQNLPEQTEASSVKKESKNPIQQEELLDTIELSYNDKYSYDFLMKKLNPFPEIQDDFSSAWRGSTAPQVVGCVFMGLMGASVITGIILSATTDEPVFFLSSLIIGTSFAIPGGICLSKGTKIRNEAVLNAVSDYNAALKQELNKRKSNNRLDLGFTGNGIGLILSF